MFADMLVAARYNTTVVGVLFGNSVGARVPARVCCGVLDFRRFCLCCGALVLVYLGAALVLARFPSINRAALFSFLLF